MLSTHSRTAGRMVCWRSSHGMQSPAFSAERRRGRLILRTERHPDILEDDEWDRLCSCCVVGECGNAVAVERTGERQLEHHHSGKEAVNEAEDLVELAQLVVEEEAEHLEEGE